eukprot:TRINITY_DN28849_c0_g1_i1.p1 TRINITY_DN28849_c0_g1~~TRINITY_DN28849_c0_g1_i1.p1  ORF type:complete len:1457 (+),score=147.72 TRINITY_DN28849_c0_g1_i1:56-4372(+)
MPNVQSEAILGGTLQLIIEGNTVSVTDLTDVRRALVHYWVLKSEIERGALAVGSSIFVVAGELVECNAKSGLMRNIGTRKVDNIQHVEQWNYLLTFACSKLEAFELPSGRPSTLKGVTDGYSVAKALYVDSWNALVLAGGHSHPGKIQIVSSKHAEAKELSSEATMSLENMWHVKQWGALIGYANTTPSGVRAEHGELCIFPSPDVVGRKLEVLIHGSCSVRSVEYQETWKGVLIIFSNGEVWFLASPESPAHKLAESKPQDSFLGYVQDWKALVVRGIVYASASAPQRKLMELNETVTAMTYVQPWCAMVVATVSKERSAVRVYSAPDAPGTTLEGSMRGRLDKTFYLRKDLVEAQAEEGQYRIKLEPGQSMTRWCNSKATWNKSTLRADVDAILPGSDEGDGWVSFQLKQAGELPCVQQLEFVEPWGVLVVAWQGESPQILAYSSQDAPAQRLEGLSNAIQRLFWVPEWQRLLVASYSDHANDGSDVELEVAMFSAPDIPGTRIMFPCKSRSKRIAQLLYVNEWSSLLLAGTAQGDLFSFSSPDALGIIMDIGLKPVHTMQWHAAGFLLVHAVAGWDSETFVFDVPGTGQKMGPGASMVITGNKLSPTYFEQWNGIVLFAAAAEENSREPRPLAYMATSKQPGCVKLPGQMWFQSTNQRTAMQYVKAWDCLVVAAMYNYPDYMYELSAYSHNPSADLAVKRVKLECPIKGEIFCMTDAQDWGAFVVADSKGNVFAFPTTMPLNEDSSNAIELKGPKGEVKLVHYVKEWNAILVGSFTYPGWQLFAYTKADGPARILATGDATSSTLLLQYVQEWQALLVLADELENNKREILIFKSPDDVGTRLELPLGNTFADKIKEFKYFKECGTLLALGNSVVLSITSPDGPVNVLRTSHATFIEAWNALVYVDGALAEHKAELTIVEELGGTPTKIPIVSGFVEEPTYVPAWDALVLSGDRCCSVCMRDGRSSELARTHGKVSDGVWVECWGALVLQQNLQLFAYRSPTDPGIQLPKPEIAMTSIIKEFVELPGAGLVAMFHRSTQKFVVVYVRPEAYIVIAHPAPVQKMLLCSSRLVLLSGVGPSDVQTVYIEKLSFGIVACQRGFCDSKTGLLMQQGLYFQTAVFKVITFAQLASFAVAGKTPLPTAIKHPGAALVALQSFGIHNLFSIDDLFVISQFVSWIIVFLFVFVQERAQSEMSFSPYKKWPKIFYKSFSTFCQYSMGPLLIPLLKTNFWPLAHGVMWWPLRILGALSSLLLTVIAMRLASVDHRLERIEQLGLNVFNRSGDWVPTDFARALLYRHPLSPRSPNYDNCRILIKTLLTLMLLFVVPENPFLAALFRVPCGAALLLTGCFYNPYFESVGAFWNAVARAGDAGVLTSYIASAVAASGLLPLDGAIMLLLSVSSMPIAAITFWRCLHRAREEASDLGREKGLREPLLAV